MAQSLSRVYVHITFSTKGRYPLIDADVEQELWNYIGGVCGALSCQPLCVGGYHDHIHICCMLSRSMAQAKLIEEVKKGSSKWIKTQGERFRQFYWQDGYGIFSVHPSEADRVVEYIRWQHEHHETCTYEEEFVAFLGKYKVEYDERYLWD